MAPRRRLTRAEALRQKAQQKRVFLNDYHNFLEKENEKIAEKFGKDIFNEVSCRNPNDKLMIPAHMGHDGKVNEGIN